MTETTTMTETMTGATTTTETVEAPTATVTLKERAVGMLGKIWGTKAGKVAVGAGALAGALKGAQAVLASVDRRAVAVGAAAGERAAQAVIANWHAAQAPAPEAPEAPEQAPAS